MKGAIFILAILFLSHISASCSTGQIDINTGSIEELDQLQGIGPVKAQAIVDARPFDGIDELIDVQGIGEVTLENIKSQGLACVSGEEGNEESEVESDEKKEVESIEVEKEEKVEEEPIVEIETKVKKLEVIRLDAQTIKSADNKEMEAKDHTIYWILGFGGIVGVLFLLKTKFRRYKNEFN